MYVTGNRRSFRRRSSGDTNDRPSDHQKVWLPVHVMISRSAVKYASLFGPAWNFPASGPSYVTSPPALPDGVTIGPSGSTPTRSLMRRTCKACWLALR